MNNVPLKPKFATEAAAQSPAVTGVAATGTPATSGAKSSAQAEKTFSILIIAKNPEVEGLMQTLLKASGFDCQFAPQGGVGLAMFESNPADLVLISTDLPDRNGFEVCLKLREKSTVPVLMVTTKRSSEEEFRGLKVGADAYLEEPFNSKLVMAHIVAQLRRTYKYDGQSKRSDAAQEEQEQGTPVPAGWASCDACHYMGPQTQFATVSSEGDAELICPNCGAEQRASFEVG